jgi:hypothetical protein
MPSDEILIAAWHSEVTPQETAAELGVSPSCVYRAWHRLQRQGLLPAQVRKNKRRGGRPRNALPAQCPPRPSPSRPRPTDGNDAPRIPDWDPLLARLQAIGHTR